jgi:hypothetical protein
MASRRRCRPAQRRRIVYPVAVIATTSPERRSASTIAFFLFRADPREDAAAADQLVEDYFVQTVEVRGGYDAIVAVRDSGGVGRLHAR